MPLLAHKKRQLGQKAANLMGSAKASNDNILNCLSTITSDQMKKYLSAGNPNYAGVMRTPDDIVVTA